MYRIIHGSGHELQDVARFIAMINTLERCPVAEARSLFDAKKEIVVARAPGRLDVMGGIGDYSGSLVLQLPLQEATCAALQMRPERKLRLVSLGVNDAEQASRFEMRLDDFERGGRPIAYAAAHEYFRKNLATRWAAYAAGAFLVLMKECSASFNSGAHILISSEVPQGKGVSSSAALEVAVMAAICSAFHLKMPPAEMARLCQKVENLIAGAPCGIMDQMTAVCGQAQRLLSLLCQPAILHEPIPIPDHLSFWGIDSGTAHSVSGTDYTSVRVGTFMGYRIIAELEGYKITPGKSPAHVSISDEKWKGYLANIPPAVYERDYAAHVPEQIKGREFVERYRGTSDEVTVLEPEAVYRVARPTAHPIYENARVRTFAELLRRSADRRVRQQLGGLMYESHRSYSACGLGAAGTDRLVELARALGFERGIYGAKITGGGSGGTVAILGDAGAHPAIVEMSERYAEETHQPARIFSGSSMGAYEFGHLVLGGS